MRLCDTRSTTYAFSITNDSILVALRLSNDNLMSPTPLVSDSSCSNSVLATDTATDPPSSTVIPPTQKLSDIPSITDWIDERCIEPDTQMASSQQDLSSPPRSQEHDDDESSQHDHSHSDQLSELDDRAKMPPPAMPKNQKGANGYHEQDKQETNGDDTLDMDAEASQVFNGQVEHADSTTSTDPAAKIPDFDWDDLKAQQVQKMTELNQHEAEIMAEFDQVTQVSRSQLS